MSTLQQLEQESKQGVSPQKTRKIQLVYQQIKLLGAHMIAQEIMYPKQKLYEYSDKAGKQLAWVLSERPAAEKAQAVLKAEGISWRK